jgi:hypothetical protein
MLEVTHETTITVLDLSCHCQTNAELRNIPLHTILDKKNMVSFVGISRRLTSFYGATYDYLAVNFNIV